MIHQVWRVFKRMIERMIERVRVAGMLQGDPPSAFYYILTGRADVIVDSTETDGPEVMATLGAGEGFGERGLLEGKPRAVRHGSE